MTPQKSKGLGFIVIFPFLLTFIPLSADALVPQEINYQGYLTDADGMPVDGDYVMTFAIYSVSSGGTPLWTETHPAVTVANGIYNVQLGSVTSFPTSAGLFDTAELYLGVTVGTDPEMTPRQALTSVAFAFKAEDADALAGYGPGDFSLDGHHHDTRYVNENQANAITSGMITNEAISAADLGINSVGASEIAADSVGQSELAPNSVGSAEIIDGEVTAEDLQDEAALKEISDDDGPGSGLNADLLDNLNSSAFVLTTQDYGRSGVSLNLYEGTSTLASKYVNATGDTMTGMLTTNTIGRGILVDANPIGSTLYGISIDADQSAANNYTTYGLYVDTDSSASSASIYGTYSDARKNAGTGSVYGARHYAYHFGTGGGTYGTYSSANGSDTGDAYGLYSSASKPSTDTGGTAYGGRFLADNDSSGSSFGVFSQATGTGGTSIGVRSIASGGDYNYALYGSATGGTKSWAGYFYGLLGVDSYGTGTDRQSIILDPDAYALKMYTSTGAETVMLQGSSGGIGSYLRLREADGHTTFELDAEAGTNGGAQLWMRNGAGGGRVFIDGDYGDAGYLALYNATGSLTIRLDGDYSGGDGRIITEELQITGGSDLSEQFDIEKLDEDIKPGMLVSIDPERPGKLTISTEPYDNKVAGVISGAGGIKPGMLMGQEGTTADGAHPVALTGRVYCWVDASQGAIKPGDLLTTSDVPGHAMKVRDHQKALGAIIGKAMTSLEKGRGLVLVLASLQ